MLYHQQMLAQVKLGSIFLAASQIFSPLTSLFDCSQNLISHSSRKYQPLPTMPCSLGCLPVRYVDCTVQVTAGMDGLMLAMRRDLANMLSRGVCAPMSEGVSPTMLMT